MGFGGEWAILAVGLSIEQWGFIPVDPVMKGGILLKWACRKEWALVAVTSPCDGQRTPDVES